MEINNISNTNIEVSDILSKIIEKIGVDINNNDISSTIKIPKKNKMIVEFSTLHKKQEIMRKIKGLRVQMSVGDGERLLWMAKPKPENAVGDTFG